MTLRIRHLKRLATFTAGQNDSVDPGNNAENYFTDTWSRLKQVVCQLCQSKFDFDCRLGHQPSFTPGQLSDIHEDIHLLLLSKAGAFMFDFYQSTLLPMAMELILINIKNDESDIVTNLTAAWHHFYTHMLPDLEALFITIKSPRLSVRNATLVAFRDLIVLELDSQISQVFSEMFAEGSVSPALKQMVLVIQNVCDCYPPSSNRLAFEKLTARIVSPYLGFKGLYSDGETIPRLRSTELDVAHLRRISVVDPRRLTRPLSVSSSLHMETLTDLFVASAERF